MKRFVRAALALALVAPAFVAAQAKPVVAVLYFDNNSIGKDRADYEGVGKGMAEFMIHELLQNPNVRVVERERIQALMVEQNLTKAGSIDPQTAIRLGKIVGAQYMVYGTFMSDGRGNFALTGRTTNVETSVISNPTRINSKGDDVMAMIAQLTAKMSAEMKIPALRVGDAGGMGGAVPAGQPAAGTPAAPASTVAEAKTAEPKAVAAKPAEAKAAAPKARKRDMKTAMLYSKALEEEDAGNKAKAVELYRQVDVKFPDYAPVRRKISTLTRG
jgi:TolB-like protein